MIALPDLLGEKNDTESGNTFLPNILPLCLLEFGHTVARPPSGAHLGQPFSLISTRGEVFLAVFVKKREGGCAQLFGYQNSLCSWPEGKKEECIIK